MEENQKPVVEQVYPPQEAAAAPAAVSAELQPPENVLAGVVGSFLFSLIGALLWFAVYQIGIIAAICGLVTVICAINGYRIFARKLSMKGIVISIVISVLMIFLAEYTCVAYEIYKAYSEVYSSVSFFAAFRSVFDFMTLSGEITGAVIRDLVIGYALGAVGSFAYIRNIVQANRMKKQQELLQSMQSQEIK